MPRVTLTDENGITIWVAILRNWPIGQTRIVSPYSEVVQWILDAHWYNFEPEDRGSVTNDIEATKFLLLTPTRLGVWLQYTIDGPRSNRQVTVFIQMYDTRVMKLNCFSIRTYKQLFAKFFADLL